RLGSQAAIELADGQTLLEFQHWLEKNDCYIFTINGFPYGRFHGAPVKESVYLPDWSSNDRLAYTNLLFDLLAKLLPEGVPGSVSTLPGAFKQFASSKARKKAIRQNLWRCVEHVSHLSQKSHKQLHLGLEPEPLCLLENSAETITFFQQMREEHGNDRRLDEFLGVNYDCCHFAVEFEEPAKTLAAFEQARIRISKIHLSSALKTSATPDSLAALKKFTDDIYLHQVIARDPDGQYHYFRDLPDALNSKLNVQNSQFPEWRIHYHVPVYARAISPFQNTTDHLLGALDWLKENPKACSHLEMETYTWDVLPPELKSRTVIEQLAAEYKWTLAELAKRGIA
ncbi:MAG TPA: metabolite traffic protein EboE, partial [Verrucomicrobiae bacterium]|nr:metabolite traffic protein EboE [Verrucomicrobiae bacterium]